MTFARRNLMFPASSTLILAAYTVSIFVSALLLFSVQPLFTKMILPRLGGSPAVWSVAMVFFQSLLLGGYAYAHFLMTFRNRVIPVVIHLILLSIAFLTLPLAIGESWSNPPESGYQLWMLALFAGTVGLPFFALAANNPLLQAWFVRTRRSRSLFPLRFLQYRQLFGAAFISARAGTDFFAANTESDLDGWLWTFDSTDCRLRHLVVAGAGIFISGQ